MSVAELVSKVIAGRQRREAAKIDSYSELVDLLAEGADEPAAEDVDRVLDAADKTVESLEKDVQTRKRRRQLQEVLADKPKVDAEYAARHKKMKSLQPNTPLRACSDLAARSQKCKSAEDELLRTYSGPLLAQYDAAREEHDDVFRRWQEINSDFTSRWKPWLSEETRPPRPTAAFTSAGMTGMTDEEWAEHVAYHVDVARRKQKEIAAFDKRMAELIQLQDDLREQMILA